MALDIFFGDRYFFTTNAETSAFGYYINALYTETSMTTLFSTTFVQPVPFFYGYFYFGFTKSCGGVLA